MTLFTADPGSKACWETSSCEGSNGGTYDWFSACKCVYLVLMRTLVFFGLQTHRLPVLTNGIYGKPFR